MIKSSALYIVVIVSLLIAMISASLLTIAFYYRQEVQKKARLDRLLVNMESGTAILLSEGFDKYNEIHAVDLFDDQQDSLILRKEFWGVYELSTVKAFKLKDTLKRAFLSGYTFDDPNTIYLADEDRPLSVSGATQLVGGGELPKSGLRQAYVDGKPYKGKELIKGVVKNSERDLPPLNEALLKGITKYFKSVDSRKPNARDSIAGIRFDVTDSLLYSFFNPTRVYQLDVAQMNIGARKIVGRVILVSDTIVKVAAESQLTNVQIYAPAIVVADGFKGSCQLFARDSIIIGKNCVFDYPSFAGVFKPDEKSDPKMQDGRGKSGEREVRGQPGSATGQVQSKISLAEGTQFSGILLSYEKKRSQLQTIISLAKGCKINGEVFATGYVKMEKSVVIYGKTYAKRFIMQTPATLYENYLIDITFNRKLLSGYYLSSSVFKRDIREQQILRWLN